LLARMGTTTVSEVRRRWANEHVAFVACFNNQPAAFGWMARTTAAIGELNHELTLPVGNRYLWNFRTLAAYRGRGIYPALLQHMIRYEVHNTNRFWIIHAPENQSSMKGIRKAGFQYVGKLYTNRSGIACIEHTRAAGTFRRLLEEMGFRIAAGEPASRWNCSSSHFKKVIPDGKDTVKSAVGDVFQSMRRRASNFAIQDTAAAGTIAGS